MRKFFFFILLFNVLATYLLGETGISVYGNVNRQKIRLDQEITYKLTIAGVGFFSAPAFPAIDGFSITQISQYTNVDFSKGKPVPYTVFEYLISPFDKGEYTLPEVYVQYKGYYYATNPIKISVTDEAAPVLERELVGGSAPVAANQYAGEPIFITSNISKTRAFYNEQLVYTYTIFTRVPLKKLPAIKFPEYEAFYREPLYYKRMYKANIKGVNYKAIEFKCALFPFMTDDHVVDGVKIICDRSCFDNPDSLDLAERFGGRSSFVKSSKNINVNVSSLPLKDKPLYFSGLVGKFEVSAEVDKQEVSVDDTIVLTVHVKGQGNLRSIPDIRPPLVYKLREYQFDIFLNYDKTKNTVSGEKLFRTIFMPTEEGEEIIPSIGFSYFDEDAKTYLTKWTKPIKIMITKKSGIKKENKETIFTSLWSTILDIYYNHAILYNILAGIALVGIIVGIILFLKKR